MIEPVLRTERIAGQREWVFAQTGWQVDRELAWHRYTATRLDEPVAKRHGGVFAHIMETIPVEINDHELIVGRVRRREMTAEEEEERRSWGGATFSGPLGEFLKAAISPDAHESVAQHRHTAGGMTGHMTPDKRTARRVPPIPASVQSGRAKVGRNEDCPCGSGLKYKKCCGAIPSRPSS